ncbi:MAG: DUF4292 domain-containing protein [Bacteroidota bacterium]|nr:DUF4292 domain-containing protein [Bacteroidota bacterium]
MKRSLLVVVAISLLFSACRSAKKIQGTSPVSNTDTAVVLLPPAHLKEDSVAFIKDIYKTIISNRIDFTTFSGKIDMDYEDGTGNKYNVNAHVRMYKDSVIWISITAILGIEGLRVFITPDSVKVLDKQNKVYKPRSIAFLREMTALPLDLPALQDLLIGNPVFLDSNISYYNKAGGTITLLSNGAFFKNLLTIGETDKLLQNSKLSDNDLQRNRSCYLTYSDYENKKGVNFPDNRSINVIDKVKLDLKMNFKQYEFNEKLSFPFPVPKNYEVN